MGKLLGPNEKLALAAATAQLVEHRVSNQKVAKLQVRLPDWRCAFVSLGMLMVQLWNVVSV